MATSRAARPSWLARRLAPAGPAEPRHLRHPSGGVIAVPGRYCVTYLVVIGDSVAVVDLGSEDDGERVLAELAVHGLSASNIRYLIPTHLHVDHIAGMDGFARQHQIPIALGPVALRQVRGESPPRYPRPAPHHAVRLVAGWVMSGAPAPKLRDLRKGLGFGLPKERKHFGADLVALPTHGQPLPGFEPWQVLETPGHAVDAIALYHPTAHWLIAGDTVLNFLGSGEWNGFLADPAGFAQTQELLCSLAVDAVFVGHGPMLEGPDVVSRVLPAPALLP